MLNTKSKSSNANVLPYIHPVADDSLFIVKVTMYDNYSDGNVCKKLTGYSKDCDLITKIVDFCTLHTDETHKYSNPIITIVSKSDLCEVIIVDPGRGRHGKFSRKMQQLGFSASKKRSLKTDFIEPPFKGWILEYAR